MNKPVKKAGALSREIAAFRGGLQCAVLATVDDNADPDCSYAPYVANDRNEIFVFVSELAHHTRNFRIRPVASLMFIEDESQAANPFARRRLTYCCRVEPVPPDDPEWSYVLEQFQQRFGRFIETLKALPDFHLFRLLPLSGRYVGGFGEAYHLDGDGLTRITPVGPDNLDSPPVES